MVREHILGVRHQRQFVVIIYSTHKSLNKLSVEVQARESNFASISGTNDKRKTQRRSWKCKKAQREFLDNIMKDEGIGIDKFKEFSVKDLRSRGGRELLRYYPTVSSIFINLYPEHEWNIFDFAQKPRGFWNDKENHFGFLKHLFIKYNLQNISDLALLSCSHVKHSGG